jgi:hypothetical protein
VCDGSAVPTASYQRLFNIIGYTYGGAGGNFNLPDLRGEFVRGFDSGRGVDPGRIFGSSQASDVEPHKHNVDDLFGINDDQGPPLYDRNGNRVENYSGWGNDGDGDTGNPTFFLNQTALSSGTETRPRNVALLPIIKY